MAFTDKPWDGSASRFASTDAYCASCLVDDNPSGKDKVQSLCHLPVKEPDGTVNTNAVHNAAARLMQTKMSPADKKKAARALQSLYRQMKEDVPESVKNMAH